MKDRLYRTNLTFVIISIIFLFGCSNKSEQSADETNNTSEPSGIRSAGTDYTAPTDTIITNVDAESNQNTDSNNSELEIKELYDPQNVPSDFSNGPHKIDPPATETEIITTTVSGKLKRTGSDQFPEMSLLTAHGVYTFSPKLTQQFIQYQEKQMTVEMVVLCDPKGDPRELQNKQRRFVKEVISYSIEE
jgi:hypothetical protein